MAPKTQRGLASALNVIDPNGSGYERAEKVYKKQSYISPRSSQANKSGSNLNMSLNNQRATALI
jgi:hypothetical protein